jgi:hypothetical protein
MSNRALRLANRTSSGFETRERRSRSRGATDAKVDCAQLDNGSGQNCATVMIPMSTWCAATVSVPMELAAAVAKE